MEFFKVEGKTMKIMLKSKINHVKVTNKDLTYMGSIYIDEELLEKSNIKKYEKVEVINTTNGKRWETYAMPEKKGSGIISVRGGGARLCETGDTLIILAYELTDKEPVPKIILVDNNNKFIKYII